MKVATVHAGVHIETLKIADLQGNFGLHDIKVFVCDCLMKSNCQSRRALVTASGAIIVALATMLLFCKL